jgi:hypothetical protein
MENKTMNPEFKQWLKQQTYQLIFKPYQMNGLWVVLVNTKHNKYQNYSWNDISREYKFSL